MSAPTTDRGGIQQTIRALIADGWSLVCVDNGEDNVRVSGESAAIEEIEATGIAHLHVKRGPERGWVFFVLGNDPEEVVCDHTTNLTAVYTLTDGWY